MRNLSIALGLLVAVLLVNGQAAAAPPEDRCSACKITATPTPRPTPLVVGITPAPAVTLPPTDTLP